MGMDQEVEVAQVQVVAGAAAAGADQTAGWVAEGGMAAVAAAAAAMVA